MAEPRAFATTNPVTVAAFLAACDAEREFARSVVESAAAIGRNKGPLRSSGVFGEPPETIGLAEDDPQDPPDGWIYSKSQEHLVPRRGKAGDPAREWLKAHQPIASARKVTEEHGLPFNDLLGHADNGITRLFNVPIVFHHDGTLWALYRGTPGRWAGGAQEPGPGWDERKLSEFYAARESRDAAEPTPQAVNQ